jgi:hypothetical protein
VLVRLMATRIQAVLITVGILLNITDVVHLDLQIARCSVCKQILGV